jgi:hypothetical protein
MVSHSTSKGAIYFAMLRKRRPLPASSSPACLPPLTALRQSVAFPGSRRKGSAARTAASERTSKRLGSRYVSGRSKDWLEFKNPEHRL